ncbi:MAG TPA: ATP-binding protein [Spirochaetota bacterium]|nr:ATP-binding protein [Spirochaetota bacterium]HPR47214.1 ATP-binding protein [Spirochaetota bacterium]
MQKDNLDKKFQLEVMTAIKNQSDIVFVSYSVLEDTENKIKFALAKILEKHQKEEIFTPILSCIKELIANATKANAKKILIDEGKITDVDDTVDVVAKIRSILNEEALLEYGIKAKMKRLSTRIYLKSQGNNLIVEVVNNIPLSTKELKKITERIERSSKYDNIAEFYMENPDPEAEGMGLGLSMVVVLLKNINISHRNFIVTTDNKLKTYAKILVPLGT